ncbi:MAG: hypothetical protein ACRDJV_13140 [Actinomycetota bacterium]
MGLKTITPLMLTLLLSVACGEAAGEAPVEVARSTQEQEEVSREVLTQADELARSYGREHLGHYLKLDRRELVRAGLDIPEVVTVKVWAGHTGYCISAINRALPSIHPWRLATIGGESGLSSKDRCRR